MHVINMLFLYYVHIIRALKMFDADVPMFPELYGNHYKLMLHGVPLYLGGLGLWSLSVMPVQHLLHHILHLHGIIMRMHI